MRQQRPAFGNSFQTVLGMLGDRQWGNASKMALFTPALVGNHDNFLISIHDSSSR